MVKLEPRLILVLLALYFGYNHRNDILNKVMPTTTTTVNTTVVGKDRNVVAPAADVQAAVQPIINIVKSSTTQRNKAADALAVGDFYGDFNKIIVSPGNILKTNTDLKNTLALAGKAHFQNVGFKETDYPGLGQAIDVYLAQRLGLQAGAIDVSKTSQALSGLQWAFYEAAK